jgi:hypothetical protein
MHSSAKLIDIESQVTIEVIVIREDYERKGPGRIRPVKEVNLTRWR